MRLKQIYVEYSKVKAIFGSNIFYLKKQVNKYIYPLKYIFN